MATQSECNSLAVVCGCFCFYSLLHLQNPLGELHKRSDSCMCTPNSCFAQVLLTELKFMCKNLELCIQRLTHWWAFTSTI